MAGNADVCAFLRQNLIQGGLVSLLSIFPPAEKPTSSDRILSFENTSSPYGFCVALAAAASGTAVSLPCDLR